MQILVFDVKADFAFFKVPEGTRSSFSFPFPPKTALVGLIAAIMGEERNKYWNENSDFYDLKLGVKILKNDGTLPIKMNYWRSKTTFTIEDVRYVLPGGDVWDRGFTTQVKIEYLVNVSYRIYVSSSNSQFLNNIADRIKNHKYYYPPYLGHANLLAEIEYIDLIEGKSIRKGDFRSLIPISLIDISTENAIDFGNFSLYYSVPTKYDTTEVKIGDESFWKSSPKEFSNLIVPQNDIPISVPLKENFGYKIKIENKEEDICVW